MAFSFASSNPPFSSFSSGASAPPHSFGFGEAPTSSFITQPIPNPGSFSLSAPSATLSTFAPAASSFHPASQAAPISRGSTYSSLTPDIRLAIHKIHEAIVNHRRTMFSLQSVAPKALLPVEPAKLGAKGDQGQPAPLAVTIRQLLQNIVTLEQETGMQTLTEFCKDEYATLIKQAVAYGKWQTEALAIRRGVHLRPLPNDQKQPQPSQPDGKGSTGHSGCKAQLQAILDRQMAHVDRMERIPSPYLWQMLEDLERHLHRLKGNAWAAQQQIRHSLHSQEPANFSSIVQSQHRALFNILAHLSNLHSQLVQLRQHYLFYERGENVLEQARYEEQQREERLNNKIQTQYVQAAASTTQAPSCATPEAHRAIETRPAPAPGNSGFSFGTPSTSKGQAVTNLFGGTPAAAPTGGFFGSASVSQPAPGAPAPAPAFSFSSTPGTSSSSTPKLPKNKSRYKNRLGR